MILHIGWEKCVETEDILILLNKSSVAQSSVTNSFIGSARRGKRFTPCPEKERAYIITADEESSHVYASALNSSTLQRRIQENGLYEVN